MALPIAALAWTGLAAGTLLRTFYHPCRALLRDGYAERCAGAPSCDPTMDLKSLVGVAPVYSVASGRVIAVGPGYLHLASQHEPVILAYEHVQQLQVTLGQNVGIGQQIGLSSVLRFSVFGVLRSGAGALSLAAIEPAAWLAARGLRISEKSHPAARWCEGGRKIQTPAAVPTCGLKLPVPSGFMLLPVSVTSE